MAWVAQCAFESAADDQHGRAMHQGPEREHQAVVLAGRPAKFLRQPFPH